jgi:hypothetical protein
MYDPITHQMTSPDIHDPNPYLSQSYNRYSYVLNNPMKYVDPSGYYWKRGSYQICYATSEISDGGYHVFNVTTGYYNYWVDEEFGLFDLPTEYVGGGYASGGGISRGGGRDGTRSGGRGNYPWDVPSGQGGNQLDPSISAGISIGGGFVGGLENSYKYGSNTVKYAQRINGQVRNAQVLTRASQMNAAKMASGLKVVGRGVTGLSVATAGYQFANSDMSGNDYARLTGSLVITGTAFIPLVGPIISIGLGVADSYGAFDGIYNYFE